MKQLLLTSALALVIATNPSIADNKKDAQNKLSGVSALSDNFRPIDSLEATMPEAASKLSIGRKY